MPDDRTDAERAAAGQKAAADAQSAELDRDKKQEELEEWRANAHNRAAEATANLKALQLKNSASEITDLQSMVPDLGKVTLGTTSVPDDKTLFQALLGGRALQDAARHVIGKVKGSTGLGNDYRVLVTTDVDLAARDSEYQPLLNQLGTLTHLAEQALARKPEAHEEFVFPLVPLAVVAAQALPGILSLAASRKKLTASESTVDDTIALFAVAGALAEADPGATVVVDRARVVQEGGAAQTVWQGLGTAADRLDEAIHEASGNDALKSWADDAGEVLKACRTALTAVTTVPDGATYSALGRASLQDELHDDTFQGVLVVKGGAASSTQLLEDRAFFGDPISIISTATLAFLLIKHRDGSKVLRGGLLHGEAQASGKVGSKLDLTQLTGT